MIDLIYLKGIIENNNIEEAKDIIYEIGEQKYTEALPFLIEFLKGTNSHELRNCIALSLMDIGSDEAVEPIIEMLKDPKTLSNRGTLLYALEPLEYSAHIEFLVSLLIDGNWEVRHNSLKLIDLIKKDIPDESLLKCIINVKKEMDELEDKLDVLSESVNILCNLKK